MESHICAIFNLPDFKDPGSFIAIYDNCAVKDIIKILDNYDIEDNMIEIAQVEFISTNEDSRDITITPLNYIRLKDYNVQDLYQDRKLETFLNKLYYQCISKNSDKRFH